MTDKRITGLDAATILASTDLIPVVVDPAGTPITKKITLENLKNSIGVWATYTPTWTAVDGTTTLGNGTLEGRYCKIGKLVFLKIHFVWGSTTSCTGAAWKFTLPANDGNHLRDVGSAYLLDNGTGFVAGICAVEDGSDYLRAFSPTSGEITRTVPFTWANGDALDMSICYEAE